MQSWPDAPATVMQNVYLEALWRAGADEAIVAPRSHHHRGREALPRSGSMGSMLVGGGDVDPAALRPVRAIRSNVRHRRRRRTSLETSRWPRRRSISASRRWRSAAGLQVLNVALGGSRCTSTSRTRRGSNTTASRERDIPKHAVDVEAALAPVEDAGRRDSHGVVLELPPPGRSMQLGAGLGSKRA